MATERGRAKVERATSGSALPARTAAARGPTANRHQSAKPLGKKGPQSMANILAELMARSGVGRVQSVGDLQKAWQEAAGPMVARFTRAGTVRRGKLEVIVANSTFMQELNYQKPAIVEALAKLLPDQKINDIRFRLGAID